MCELLMVLEIDHFNIFFSLRDDFNISVLQAFVELHEFADLNLVQALRWAVLVNISCNYK